MKENLRQEALEKEIQKLKSIAHSQSKKLHRLRTGMFFMVLFFVLLFIMLFIKGVIVMPDPSNQETTSSTPVAITPTPISKAVDPVPDKMEDGLIFKIPDNGILYSVQIGAYAGIEMTPYQLNLLSLRNYQYQGINQYSAGLFTDIAQAQGFLNIIQQMGFGDAFIISTLDGKRIAVNEALEIQSNPNPQHPATQKELPKEILNENRVGGKLAADRPAEMKD